MNPSNFRRLPLALLSLALALPATAAVDVDGRPIYVPVPAPRIDLRALATAKSFDRFIVRYRAGSAAEADRGALDATLQRAAVRAQEQLKRERQARGLGIAEPSWTVRSLRRLAVGADVFASSRKLDPQQVRLLLQQIAADPDVEYVEIDQILHHDGTPNDTNYVDEWGLQDADAGIRANLAWNLGNGAGAVVAVIDTGYTNHSDLLANILPGYDFISDVTQANDGNGRDADAHDPGDWTAAENSSWHGTHVSGTIAAVTNNAKGVAGAAFAAKIVPARVLGVGGGAGSDIADAIVWASGGTVAGVPANANPAEVINMSLGGGGGCSATYQNAINSAVSRGTTVVVSAGNDNLDAGLAGSLSTCANVIVVGAHTDTAARSGFSNYGTVVDVTAPGSSILSTINTGTTVPAAEGYAYYQGTSMAAPHVAAAAALLQAYRVKKGLAPYTPAQVETVLKATGYPLSQGCSVSSGGIVDARTLLDTADGAVRLVGNGTPVPNQSAAAGVGLRYAMTTRSTAQGLVFSAYGGSGDATMYVKFGSMPTTVNYDCRSTEPGTNETCIIPVAQPGTYYMLLQGASGFSGATVVGNIAGNRKPAASFYVTPNGLSATFTDTSTDTNGAVTGRSWNFGDGATSTAVNPSHAFSIAGAYSVQLRASDAQGASNCMIRQVNVNPNSVALSNGIPVNNLAAYTGGQLPFTLAVPSGASNLHFDTTLGTGDADLYVKFGSAPTLSSYDCISAGPTTTETCTLPSATAGTWHVMVHAFTDISGVRLKGTYVAAGALAAAKAPSASFGATTRGLTARFTDTSIASDGAVASWRWDFGDGSSSTLANPSHTYAAKGTYQVTLTVTGAGGASGFAIRQVTAGE